MDLKQAMDLQLGYYYHIYNRGNNSQKIFFKQENYLFFLKKMREQITPFASIIAWCLMPNHFHIVIFLHKEEVEVNIDTLTQSEGINKTRTVNQSIGILLRSYTRAIQKQENKTGSLFQKHTKAKALVDEIKIDPAYWNTTFGTQINISEGKSYLETSVEYIHKNPVYSGLTKKAEDWEFSSYRDYLEQRKGTLLDYEMIKKEGLMWGSDTLTSSKRITKNTCIIGIGSNIDADKNISSMLEILKDRVEVVKVSPMLQTKPIGIENQPDYTNGAVKIKTEHEQKSLIKLLKQIEDQLGRDRTGSKFGPRTIDLDIVAWNGEIVDQDYYTRDFIRASVHAVDDGPFPD